MNLILDIGNTFIKVAVFNDDDLIFKSKISPEDFATEFQNLLNEYPNLKFSIISATGDIPQGLVEQLESKLEVIHFSHESKINFKNGYKTPETLGLDRIALTTAAAGYYPSRNVLIIDAGTCITYDFLDANNIYHGGAISPGIQMRFNAMHNFTANLPLIKQATADVGFLGKTTRESMEVGVLKSIQYEIDGFIEDYLADYEDLTVILTGGDYQLLSASIKNSIFATSNFLLQGLNKILQLNIN
ncbi:type III pantothenate kinase [Psychroflexus aestuariivivens]|uniref:type III pantothenate kinase n=1 Tax=Psychroflexus aestuariivivens TaxID=1795040 RepID=UPI000FDCAA3D|nr:type III pantothenate kinase [Psychroflexus aestuariivivens]